MPSILPMQGRSPGTHVSTLIHRLAMRANMYTARDLNMAKVQLGSSIEWALIERWKMEYPGAFYEIGELECEGVYGTPDLLEIENAVSGGEGAIHEMKLTWLSGRHGVWSEKLAKFWWQIMAYCYMSGLRVGVLHCWYVNGGRGGEYGSGTEYSEWTVRFGMDELNRNWKMLKREERRMLNEGLKGE